MVRHRKKRRQGESSAYNYFIDLHARAKSVSLQRIYLKRMTRFCRSEHFTCRDEDARKIPDQVVRGLSLTS
jgi:hypothetical protein